MKPIIVILSLLFFSSCFSSSSYMTRSSFDEISLGSTVAEVREKGGEPYAVHSRGDTEEYEYVEKTDIGGAEIAENHYILIIANGHVVGKRVKRYQRPAYDLLYQVDPNYYNYYNPYP